jgi:putative membrane protein
VSDWRSDPRVSFAAERTLLAWLRTGIAVMAFGFVVARFGLFLRLVGEPGTPSPGHAISPYVGAALVWLGVAATAAGALQYRRFCRALPAPARPETSTLTLSLGLAGLLAAAGAVLGVALLQ